MMQADRIAAILAFLEERGSSSIGMLASSFEVSEETIRRDLRQLQATGRVVKVHGGVMLPDHRIEAPYQVRLRENAETKQAIARLAAGEIRDGMTVFIDSGTTSFWVAREIRHVRRLTVVTNSLEIAHDVTGRGDCRVFLAGGAINADYRAAFDADAIAYCQRFVADIAILSIAAIDAQRGFLDFDPDEGAFKRALVGHARRTIVVADQSKFDGVGSFRVAGFKDVHDLFTDAPPPDDIAASTAAAGTNVHVVGQSG